jgi:hypothetical protein
MGGAGLWTSDLREKDLMRNETKGSETFYRKVCWGKVIDAKVQPGRSQISGFNISDSPNA